MTPSPPRASGVYQIRCVPTGKIYVGSAVNLRKRWGQHRSSLSGGKHKNCYLQNAWDKYGEGNFEFEILELVDVSDLLRVEQEWIDGTNCTDKTIGFNLYNIAGSPGDTFAQTWEGFIDPDGNEVRIINLQHFCRENGLDFNAMHRLSKGKSKLKGHKGWTHRNSVRQRDYIKRYEGFIDPEGKPVQPITNLAEFCRQHSLTMHIWSPLQMDAYAAIADRHIKVVVSGRIARHTQASSIQTASEL